MVLEQLTHWERQIVEATGTCGRQGLLTAMAPRTCAALAQAGWLRVSRVPLDTDEPAP